jgi:hypothetical protein
MAGMTRIRWLWITLAIIAALILLAYLGLLAFFWPLRNGV